MKGSMNKKICWSEWAHRRWQLRLAATECGLCYAGLDGFDDFVQRMNRWYPEHRLIRDDVALQPYARQFMEFFNGRRTVFEFPVDVRGTSFQLSVWDELGKIPYGQTRSYLDIAKAILKPAASRAVGAAVGANPVWIVVPCHRVVGSNGSLTGYRGGLEMKNRLLRLENNNLSSFIRS